MSGSISLLLLVYLRRVFTQFFFELIVADKKAACAAIGGALKARNGWSLEKCEIECCTGNNCNIQTPVLLEDSAITVFLPPGNAYF